MLPTTFISECWSAYRDLERHRYIHKTVNHTIGYVGVHTGGQRTQEHVAAFESIPAPVQPHCDYMLEARCQSYNVDHCTKFIGLVATMDCSAIPLLDRRHVGTDVTHPTHLFSRRL